MKRVIFLLILIASLAWAPYLLAAMNSSHFQIWSDTFSVGGGEDQTSTNYSLQDTLDQGISSGLATSTNNNMYIGYRSINYFAGREILTLSIDNTSLDFGTLKKTENNSVSHGLTVQTNSAYGLRVTYSGSTLTSSSATITAIGGTPVAAQFGTSQFGLNVIYSTSSPASPHAEATSAYNQSGSYAFSSGDTVITSSGEINSTTFIVNYIANIAGSEAGGTYSTTITYTATANF